MFLYSNKNLLFYFAVLVVSVFFLSPTIAHASGLSNISDALSRLKTLEPSDHVIQFITLTGMNSGIIQISFNNAISNTNAVDYTDVDLLYGPVGRETQQGLSITPGTNTWGVAVNSVQKILTLSYPSSNGIPILPNERILILIGKQATHDTPVTKQLLRQLINGTPIQNGHRIDIVAGLSTGSVAIPIVSNDTISLLCQSTLSSPKELKAENSAGIVKLSWTDAANNESGFFVERSQEVTTAVGDAITTRNTPFDTILTIQSSNASQAADSKITAGTTYQYRVRAFNTCGFSEYSQVATVKTPPGTTVVIVPMALAPVIQPAVLPVPVVSAPVQKPVVPPIEKALAPKEKLAKPELSKELQPKPEPVKKPVEPEKPKEIKKLPPKEEVKKPEPPKAIPNVNGVRVSSTASSVTLQWQNPQVDFFDSVQIRRSDASFPQSAANGTAVFRGAASSFTDNGLDAGKIYYYTLFSLSKSGIVSSGTFITAATKELPKIPDVKPVEQKQHIKQENTKQETVKQEAVKQENANEQQKLQEMPKEKEPIATAPEQIQPAQQQAAQLKPQQAESILSLPAAQQISQHSAAAPSPPPSPPPPPPPPAPAILPVPQISAAYTPIVMNSAPLPPPAVIVSLPVVESVVVVKPEESQRTSSVMTDSSDGAPTAAFTVDIPAHTFSEETKIVVTSLSTVQTRTIDAQAIVPRGHEAVGDVVYKINIQTAKGKSVKNFDNPLRLTFRYDKSLVQTVNEQSLKVYYWQSSLTSWVPLPSSVDPKTGVIVAEVSHATLFSIFGEQRKDISHEQRMEMRVEAQAPTPLKQSVSYLLRPEDIHLTAFSKLWGKQIDSGLVGETLYVSASSILDMCIPSGLFGENVDTVSLAVSDPLRSERYFLDADPLRQCYTTSIIAPKSLGVYSLEFKSKGADDRTQTHQFSLMVVSPLESVVAPLVLRISEGFGTPGSIALLVLLCLVIIGYIAVDVRQKVARSRTKRVKSR